MSLRLRGREVRETAVAVRDPDVVAERFAYYLRRNPHQGRNFGVRVGRDGWGTTRTIWPAAACLVMVRTVLEDAYRGSDEDVTDPAPRRVL